MIDSKQASGSFVGRVQSRRTPCEDHFVLTLAIDGFPDAHPGQFVQLLCRDPDIDASIGVADRSADNASATWAVIEIPQPMLRRPFSIAGMRRSGATCELDVLARTIGPGTAWLSDRVVGDRVGVLGPLGRGFTLPQSDEFTKLLLVAGGVGLPPIRWLGEILTRAGHCCTAFIGVRTRSLLPLDLHSEPDSRPKSSLCAREFTACDIPACIVTDDGSCGVRGRVTDAFGAWTDALGPDERVMVYACGPEPMLKATAFLCAERGFRCEAAMERMMGCGMATCQSCVVQVVDPSDAEGWRYALCCTEGPVFDASVVVWEQGL